MFGVGVALFAVVSALLSVLLAVYFVWVFAVALV